jgi:GAF domain
MIDLHTLFPPLEEERQRALQELHIAGTPPEELFDDLAALSALIFDTHISLISLVTREAVWFKAQTGLPGAIWLPRQDSLCSVVVLNGSTTVFDNLQDSPCELVNPEVARQLGIQFYAGSPLLTREGHPIGALCVLDRQPRQFTVEEQAVLGQLARVVMRTIELRLVALYHPGGPPSALTAAFRYLDTTVDRIAAQLPPPSQITAPDYVLISGILTEAEQVLAAAQQIQAQPAITRTAMAVQHLLSSKAA